MLNCVIDGKHFLIATNNNDVSSDSFLQATGYFLNSRGIIGVHKLTVNKGMMQKWYYESRPLNNIWTFVKENLVAVGRKLSLTSFDSCCFGILEILSLVDVSAKNISCFLSIFIFWHNYKWATLDCRFSNSCPNVLTTFLCLPRR